MVGRPLAGAGAPEAISLDELARGGMGPHAASMGIVGRARVIADLGERILSLALSRAAVLIQGETGTGKELIARALHRHGPRLHRPFLPHNFAAIPDSLVESELFGHARGAFTGAHADRPGLFELADGGTLFLDEIGDASPSVQSRLLRVLQEGELRRLGEGRTRRVELRVVAATHRDLAAEVRAGRFRADLYYRLHVLTVRAPTLRERPGDIPLLAAHILGRQDRVPAVRGITRDALDLLQRHDWPGNVRELEATLERAVHAPGWDGWVTKDSWDDAFAPPGGMPADAPPAVREPDASLRVRSRELEARLIRAAIARAGGNRSAAARALGLSRQGLWKKMRRLASEGADRSESP